MVKLREVELFELADFIDKVCSVTYCTGYHSESSHTTVTVAAVISLYMWVFFIFIQWLLSSTVWNIMTRVLSTEQLYVFPKFPHCNGREMSHGCIFYYLMLLSSSIEICVSSVLYLMGRPALLYILYRIFIFVNKMTTVVCPHLQPLWPTKSCIKTSLSVPLLCGHSTKKAGFQVTFPLLNKSRIVLRFLLVMNLFYFQSWLRFNCRLVFILHFACFNCCQLWHNIIASTMTVLALRGWFTSAATCIVTIAVFLSLARVWFLWTCLSGSA